MLNFSALNVRYQVAKLDTFVAQQNKNFIFPSTSLTWILVRTS